MTPPDYDDLMMIAVCSEVTAALREQLREAEAENAALQEVCIDVLAHLVAAHSLLVGGGKKAAPSDKMFNQMLKDYSASIERGRAALLAGKETK